MMLCGYHNPTFCCGFEENRSGYRVPKYTVNITPSGKQNCQICNAQKENNELALENSRLALENNKLKERLKAKDELLNEYRSSLAIRH